MIVWLENSNYNEKDEGKCWLCNDEKRVEWSQLGEEDEDGNYEVIEGIYDPCPQCEEDKKEK